MFKKNLTQNQYVFLVKCTLNIKRLISLNVNLKYTEIKKTIRKIIYAPQF